MKTSFLIFWWGALVAVVVAMAVACVPPVNHSEQAGGHPTGGLGRLSVTVDSASSRATLPTSLSQDLANTYELVVTDGTVLKTLALDPTAPLFLDILPGNYRVLVLAGYRKSTTSTVTQLLGSGYAKDLVAVTSGSTTTVPITLFPVDFSWSAPASLAQGAVAKIDAQGTTGNPYVGMCLAGATTERPRLKSVTLFNGYKDFDTPTGTPDQWVCSLSVTGPLPTGTADLQFQGAVIVLNNTGAVSGSLSGKTKYSWKWLNRYDLADDCPLVPLVDKVLSLTPPENGMSVSVSWG